MGRHSAAVDDTAEDDSAVVDAVDDAVVAAGRHAQSDGSGAAAAERIGPVPKPLDAQPEAAAEPSDGIDLIHDALAAGPSRRRIPAAAAGAPAGPVAQPHDETQQIPAIADPIVDQSRPDAETQQIPVVDAPLVDPPIGPAAAPPRVKAPHGSSADLALLRHHSDVRARVIAAVLVPFVLYTIVLLVIDKMTPSTYLISIWIPLVTAGVLVGLFLDIGHRRHDPPAAT